MRINDFEVISRISEGTYGRVYKARSLSNNRIVVLKIMVVDDDKYRLAVYNNELQILERLRALNVNSIPYFIDAFNTKIDSGEGKRVYAVLAMDIVNGDTIKDFIDRNPNIRPQVLWSLYLQILQGMQFIHGRGVVHNDIKGNNLMIDKNFNVKFIDFGLSCIFDDEEKTCRVHQGTILYTPPELQYADNRDPLLKDSKFVFGRDVWSLGVLFFVMANRLKFPFKAASDMEQLKHNIVFEPLRRSSYTADDGRTNALIEFMLRKTWTERPSIDDCIAYMMKYIFAPVYVRNYTSSPEGFVRVGE